MKNSETNRFILTAVFALAMGSLEAIVAWYLRLLYYPNGFSFPIVSMPAVVLTAEMVREAATIVMIATVAWLSGKSIIQRVSLFFFIFGIWDICYYLGLKILTGWPDSLFTWDILFLIPFPWTAPVLAPIICSLLFTAFGGAVFVMSNREVEFTIGWRGILIVSSGLIIILISFLSDCFKVIRNAVGASGLFDSSGRDVEDAISRYIPEKYNWVLFLTGTGIIIISFLFFIRRTIARKQGRPQHHI